MQNNFSFTPEFPFKDLVCFQPNANEINNPEAPLLGLAKSMYYLLIVCLFVLTFFSVTT